MTNHKRVQDNLFFEVQRMLRFTLVIVIVFLASLGVSAQEADTTKYDEDFVKTSLIIASPGDMLYSKVGHCAIRMQCPQYRLDYVFSYESEDARQKVLTFLAGKLKKRDSELAKGWGQIVTPLSIPTAGGKQRVNCAKMEGVFRIIQSIPSPKAEPFKVWMAQVAAERLDEIVDPEKAILRGADYYRAKGYTEGWISQQK